MITSNLTDERLHFLLYSACSESYEKMTELMNYIDTACLTCETLWCRELFDALDIPCPEDLTHYGWNKPRQYLDNGYFYLYYGTNDDFWHIECPVPEKIDI